MDAAFDGWMVEITLIVIKQKIVDGFTKLIEMPVSFQGTVQPLSPEAIALKPDGQRSWQWLQIHCFSGQLNLVTNDRIIFNGKKYKIMAELDYSLNNYIEYHAIQDYENAKTC